MTQRAITSSVTLLICLVTVSNAAHILGVFPIPAKSHFNVNYAVMKSLHSAGHRVTVIAPFSSEKKVENFTYIVPPDLKFSFMGQSTVDEWTDMPLGYLIDFSSKQGLQYCESVMNVPEIQEALYSPQKSYDLLIVEYLLDVECYLSLAEKLGIPVIATATFPRLLFADESIGLSTNPTVTPLNRDSSNVEMNILGRIKNLWTYIHVHYYFMLHRSEAERSFRKYFPKLSFYEKKASLIFYNNHVSMFSSPCVPNAIDVGGIHVTSAQPLPKDIQKFIDEAPQGVILFSFGSIVKSSSMPTKQKEAFLTALASIPQRVIWKYEEPIENLPGNIMTSSWLPQRDILEHKNVIAFMSHCGLGGVYEAVATGTPVVTIPLFLDQRINAEVLAHRGVGVNIEFKTATKETVLSALNTIVNDTRYYQRMQELSRIFKDRPMTPQESVVYWTEYVIRYNGAPHLRAIGSDMPFYKYFMLDIIALSFLFISVVITLIYTAVRKIHALVAKKPSVTIYTKKSK